MFDIARQTSLPVLGINYRKSVTADRAFPAALQDTITGYAYLIRTGYKKIAIAGDSAGAGLALALMQYLAKMAGKNERPDKIVMPCAACFYSPWADLSFSHDYEETVHFDISKSICLSARSSSECCLYFLLSVHPTMLRGAAAAYTCTVDRYDKARDASAESSIGKMGRRHPYFSPALGRQPQSSGLSSPKLWSDLVIADSSVESLRKIKTTAEKLGQKAPE